jgi:hypothetical protein
VLVLRTRRTISFVTGFPYRHVQLVLRLYRSPAEVLLYVWPSRCAGPERAWTNPARAGSGFDLDVVAVGFDGRRVYCLPRARRALVNRYNIGGLAAAGAPRPAADSRGSQRIRRARRTAPTATSTGCTSTASAASPWPCRAWTCGRSTRRST